MTKKLESVNALTIDVEDYFQINAFSRVIRPEDWSGYPTTVERNTRRILEILDRADGGRIKGTFFVVGWVAEKFPGLIREIHEEGHEIGCHSYAHQLIFNQSKAQFREDARKSKEILENIIGDEVIGYRAPTYSITKRNLWALEVLYELGFRYDSSIFPIVHDVYGIPDAPRHPFFIRFENGDITKFETMRFDYFEDVPRPRETSETRNGGCLAEFPLTTLRVFDKNIPVAGGGYFRFFPYALTRQMLRTVNQKEDRPFVFYLHPWELDPEIPKIRGAGFISTFRTYLNLNKTADRLKRLVSDFRFLPLSGFLS